MLFWIIDRQLILFSCACLILGAVGGFTIAMLQAGAIIDEKAIQLESVYSELSEKNDRIERLEESLFDNDALIVRELNLKLNIKDPHLNLKLTNTTRELLQDIIGQRIETLNPELIRNIIDKRIVFANDQAYTLNLKYLVLAEKTILEINVTTGNTLVEE